MRKKISTSMSNVGTCADCGERLSLEYVDGIGYCSEDAEIRRDRRDAPQLKHDLRNKKKQIRMFKTD